MIHRKYSFLGSFQFNALIVATAILAEILSQALFVRVFGLFLLLFFLANFILRNKLFCRKIGCPVMQNKVNAVPLIDSHFLEKTTFVGEEIQVLRIQNRPGRRSRYSLEDKIHAIQRWESINQRSHPVLVEDFLKAEFGTTNGIPNVPRSTFYSWRRKYGQQVEE